MDIKLNRSKYKIKEIVTIDKVEESGETFQENGTPAIITIDEVDYPHVLIADYKIAFEVDTDFADGEYQGTLNLESGTVYDFTLNVYSVSNPKPHTKPKKSLKHSPDYMETTKIYTQALTHVFDDLWLRYKDNQGNEYEVDVPVLMAHASKTWKSRKAIDHELKTNKRYASLTNYKVPCITIAYIDKQPDKSRDFVNRYDYTPFRDEFGNVLFERRHPRPFNYQFKVEIWSYSQNQLEYIHEQLLPYIDEGFSIVMKEVYGENNFKFNRQINVLLDSMTSWNYTDSYDEVDNKENHLISTFNFTFEGYQFFPIKTEGITDVIRNIYFQIDVGYLARYYNTEFNVYDWEIECSGESDKIDIALRDDIADDEDAQNELIYEDGACVFKYDDFESFKNVVVSDINTVYSDCSGLVGTKIVNESNIGDGRIISYDLSSDQMVYIDNEGNVQEYKTNVDDISIHSSYIGHAELDVEPTATGWRLIKSVEEDGDIVYYYPNGNTGFNFVWEQRANYNYTLP